MAAERVMQVTVPGGVGASSSAAGARCNVEVTDGVGNHSDAAASMCRRAKKKERFCRARHALRARTPGLMERQNDQ